MSGELVSTSGRVSTCDTMAMGGTNVDIDKAWVACTQPERPPDKNVMYHVMPDCHGCNVAKEAARRLVSERVRAAESSQPQEPK